MTDEIDIEDDDLGEVSEVELFEDIKRRNIEKYGHPLQSGYCEKIEDAESS